MLLYWPKLLYPYYSLLLFSLSLLSVYRMVLWGWGLRTDRVYITLSQPCTFFYNNNNDNNIRGSVLSLPIPFLLNRSQHSMVDGYQSKLVNVVLGSSAICQ